MISFHQDMTHPENRRDWVWVFGSNLKGVHGAGAARVALDEYGAKMGQGVGFQGRSYAIPTKNKEIKTLALDVIRSYVDDFFDYVDVAGDGKRYWITSIGCGLAGFKEFQIAPMFQSNILEREYISSDLSFPHEWQPFIGPHAIPLRRPLS